ncbi:MAG TPA: hypothetical protein VJR87_06725 [Allosphingosinicella sp.]|nr:hypothetical protein [Allosphingosinicella sp.]HKT15084.1 hypothetical protein [Allosphingosinicella sp.]
MKRIALLIAAGVTAVAAPVAARPHPRDQNIAFEATQQGRLMPLREIESRVIPQMRGADYLGPELDSGRYRLKFRRGDRVIWVDVDGRTGRVVGKTGE